MTGAATGPGSHQRWRVCLPSLRPTAYPSCISSMMRRVRGAAGAGMSAHLLLLLLRLLLLLLLLLRVRLREQLRR